MIEFTSSEIYSYYSRRLPRLKRVGKELRGACPVHDGKDPNFSVSVETGQAICHSRCGGRGWDILSLEQALSSCDFPTAKEAVFSMVGRPAPTWEDRDIEATYDYCDQYGEIKYQVVRRSGKKFAQRRPSASGGWLWGLGSTSSLPFRLLELIAAQSVFVAEGERDCLTLARAGLVATCNSGGAGNFKAELVQWFRGKDVAILPDNDDPGRQHAVKVASMLSEVAQSVKIVEIPGLKPKGDVTDFLSSGGTVERLQALHGAAQPWTPEWHYTSEVPDENDRYVRSLTDELAIAGGMRPFWDFTHAQGVPTPWEKLTRTLRGGMRKGEVYVLGANQGSGKTSMAIQFTLAALRARKGVLYFSMEMLWRDLFQRKIAMEARVDLLEYERLQQAGGALMEINQRLLLSTSEIARYPLLVSTKPRVTPQYIASEALRLRKRQPVDFVVVDHMQLMGAAGKVRSEYEKFTEISRVMKEIAVEMDAPVLLVSQTSRKNSGRPGGGELEVDDLRGSGAIEEDAAAVFLLYPDGDDVLATKANKTFSTGPVKTWLKVGKNRYGHSGKQLPLMHVKRYTRFDEIEERAA